MSGLSNAEFCQLYRREVENGSWATIAEKAGLKPSTCKQKMADIRTSQIELLQKAGKSEEQARQIVSEKLPRFKRTSGVTKAEKMSEVFAELFSDIVESEPEDSSESEE